MQRFLPAIAALLLSVLTFASPAFAKPNVALKLSGVLVQHDNEGKEKLVPVERVQPKPGDLIRFYLVASNAGDEAAKNLVPIDRIPAGTVYEAGSASSKDAPHVEFSLDNGRTWSAAPTVKVKTPQGEVVKKADPTTFTTVRWIADKPLAPKAVYMYTYTVRVK